MSHRGGAHVGCADFRRTLAPDRRSFLKAGALGATGLSLDEAWGERSRLGARGPDD